MTLTYSTITKKFDYCFKQRKNRCKIDKNYNPSLSNREIPGTMKLIHSPLGRWTKHRARYFMITTSQRTALRRMPWQLRKNRACSGILWYFREDYPKYVSTGVRSHTGCDIRATYIYPGGEGVERAGGGAQGATINPARRINIPNRSNARNPRARMELFSRAPNWTLICDSDCYKLKGIPTLSLPLLHDLLDLINARCIASAGPALYSETHALILSRGRWLWKRASRTRVRMCADLRRYNWNYAWPRITFL